MTNPLPNPLPAGTVVFVPDKKGEFGASAAGGFIWVGDSPLVSKHYTRHVVTAPVHVLDEKMLEAVKSVLQAFKCDIVDWSDEAAHLRAAFADVLRDSKSEVKPHGAETDICGAVISALQRCAINDEQRVIFDRIINAIDALERRLP